MEEMFHSLLRKNWRVMNKSINVMQYNRTAQKCTKWNNGLSHKGKQVKGYVAIQLPIQHLKWLSERHLDHTIRMYKHPCELKNSTRPVFDNPVDSLFSNTTAFKIQKSISLGLCNSYFLGKKKIKPLTNKQTPFFISITQFWNYSNSFV